MDNTIQSYVAQFQEDGFLHIPGFFTEAEIESCRRELRAMFAQQNLPAGQEPDFLRLGRQMAGAVQLAKLEKVSRLLDAVMGEPSELFMCQFRNA